MRKLKYTARVLAFLLGLAALFSVVQQSFTVGNPDDRRIYHNLYHEKKGKLDAVYIGASNVYSYWQGTPAWEEYGITVITCSNPAQPVQAVKYYMREVRRIQPQALCIVNLNSFMDLKMTPFRLHSSLDYLPYSLNKSALIQDLNAQMGDSFLDSLEYYFPIIRFHSRWNQLMPTDFYPDNQNVKGGVNYERILTVTKNISRKYVTTDQEVKLGKRARAILKDLLDFCDSEKMRVLFILVPQARTEKQAGQFNYITRIVRERGYDILNLMESNEEIGLDLRTDFFNERHTNIHGSLKYTSYLGQYLQDTYGFRDKRGEAAYKDWDEAAELYQEMLAAYTLDIERDHALRDYTLPAPGKLAATVEGNSVKLSWNPSEGADGYLIYRKHQSEAWTCVSENISSGTEWTDTECRGNTTYTYTVVPYRMAEDGMKFGNFAYYGIEAQTE